MKSFFKSALFACSLMNICSLQAVKQSKEIAQNLVHSHRKYLKKHAEDVNIENARNALNSCVSALNVYGYEHRNNASTLAQNLKYTYALSKEVVQETPEAYSDKLEKHLAKSITYLEQFIQE